MACHDWNRHSHLCLDDKISHNIQDIPKGAFVGISVKDILQH